LPLVDSPQFGKNVSQLSVFGDIIDFENEYFAQICVLLDTDEECFCSEVIITPFEKDVHSV
jgi:hypothetical protein